MSTGIIGGADGPTAIFLAGSLGPGWLNLFGLFIVILMLIPNILYMRKFRGRMNKCMNRGMNVLEQTGRYVSIVLMAVNVGTAEFGFSSVGMFLSYFIGNILLLIVYWLTWIGYFRKQTLGKGMTLAIIPVCIFLLSGITLNHRLLVLSAVLFGIAHIYVTYQNER